MSNRLLLVSLVLLAAACSPPSMTGDASSDSGPHDTGHTDALDTRPPTDVVDTTPPPDVIDVMDVTDTTPPPDVLDVVDITPPDAALDAIDATDTPDTTDVVDVVDVADVADTTDAIDDAAPESGMACAMPSDCPAPVNECATATCIAGSCGIAFVAAGTAATAQTPNDCHQNQCDGAGNIVTANDDADLPLDTMPCATPTCTAGVPSYPPAARGTTCGTAGMRCDGAGMCVQCLAASDCGTDTACVTHVCTTAGMCSTIFVAPGTVVANPTAGDCRSDQCDGAGGITTNGVDNTDLPADDGSQCTTETCVAGTPQHPSAPLGTACNQNGGTVCNGAGTCVGCTQNSDCGTDNACSTHVCTAGTCSTMMMSAGTVVANPNPGDCRSNQCDASGNVAIDVADNTDVPADDGNPCTSDTCTAGAPVHPPVAALTACSVNGGVVCDDAGTCTNTVSVVRVGDGSAALSNAATAAFIEERFVSDGALAPTGHNPLALPTAVSGSNARLTLAGSSTSEGALARSSDGHYITLAGYDAAAGTAAVAGTASATVNRIAGRIDASGTIDTSTRINALISANNVRSAVTNDGTAFWVGGSANGVVYVPLGTTGGTAILATPTNVRTVEIFGGQLFGTSGSGTFVNVFTVGTGLPTMSGQTATSLPGMPTASASPYAFAFVGSNVLYVGDDRAIASGGGVQKWVLVGGTWTLVTTFHTGITVGVRGLTAIPTGATTTIVATVANASANPLVVFVDDGVNLDPTATVIATAATNTAFRGVALAPR